MQKTILYFGSFNPIHRGHIDIAQYMAGKGYGEVWMVVSPENPLKERSGLANGNDRLQMVRLAVEASNNPLIKVCDIEFSLPKPSYTIDTLAALSQRYPDREFALLTGSDIVPQLHLWKDYQKLLDNYTIWIYPRHTDEVIIADSRLKMLPTDALLLDYSSTEVREKLFAGEDCSAMLDSRVEDYIYHNGLYATTETFLARGRRYFHAGEFGEAINNFNRALKSDPQCKEAEEYLDMLREILNFRHIDIYNP